MSAKQVSSGYILWKTGPEPVRHSHRERARLLTAAPPGLPKLIGGKFHQAGEYAAVGSMGENRLPQPVPIPKKFPGIVRKRPDCSSWCLFQRDSREQCRRRQTAPDRPVPKKHLRKSAGKVRLLQAVPVPKKSPGQGRLAALVPKRPPGGSSPHPPAQKNTRKVIGPSGCSVM